MSRTILLVDSDKHFLKMLSDILGWEHYEILACRGAEEALELLKDHHIGILISDGTMVLSTLQDASERNIPVIALCYYKDLTNEVVAASKSGKITVVIKPLKWIDFLLSKIDRLITPAKV